MICIVNELPVVLVLSRVFKERNGWVAGVENGGSVPWRVVSGANVAPV